MAFDLRDELFLRAPAYSFASYDPGRLPEILREETFRNAIYLASPGFYASLENKGFDHARLSEKERHTALKYYNRMSFRPVPYGSFASFTNLEWGSGNTLLQPDAKCAIHLLPDMELSRITDGGWGAVAQLVLNPLFYTVGKQFRYIRSTPKGNKDSEFVLGAVDTDPYYVSLSRFLKRRKASVEELLAFTCATTGCDEEEAAAHINFMLEEQVLLRSAQHSPIQPAPRPPGWPAKHHYNKGGLAGLARNIAPGVDESVPRFYAALERPLQEGGPGAAVRKELERALIVLQQLASPIMPEALAAFTRAFRERFEEQQVPFLVALDPDTGIAYGELAGKATGFPDGLETLPFPAKAPEGQALKWTEVHQLLLRLWLQDTARCLHAPVEVAGGLPDARGPLSPGMSLVFRESEEHIVLEQAGGATAVSMIGRFSTFSKQTHRLCRELAQAEQAANPGVAFADIGQLSALHTDNINRRMPIYPYELPLNVSPALPPARQVLPADLYLSASNGELILYSGKLKKRVIPRLATAYNYRNTQLGAFQLLCDMQYQGLAAGLDFDPEQFFPGLSFYPRFFTGRVVLSLAKWHFKAEDLSLLTTFGEDATEPVRAFRKRHGLPQRVSVGDNDRQLVFDLSHAPEARFFLDYLKGMEKVTVREYLLPGRTVKAGHAPYAGQFIAFFTNGEMAHRPADINIPRSRVQRDHPPGSGWLYLKLYCTPVSAQRLLKEVIAPVLAGCRGLISSWHFVRYDDTGHHIRMRVKMNALGNSFLIGELQQAIAMAGLDSLVREFRTDTYRRELERYHPELMELAEAVFCASSEEVLAFHCQGPADDGLALFMAALSGACAMIQNFWHTDEQALDFCVALSERFLAEFRADKALRLAMDLKFRELRSALNAGPPGEGHTPHLAGAVTDISKASSALLHKDRTELLASLVHMHLNRLFPAEQRRQEMLAYYCLAKHLRSLTKLQAARTSAVALADQ